MWKGTAETLKAKATIIKTMPKTAPVRYQQQGMENYSYAPTSLEECPIGLGKEQI